MQQPNIEGKYLFDFLNQINKKALQSQQIQLITNTNAVYQQWTHFLAEIKSMLMWSINTTTSESVLTFFFN